MDAEKTDSRCYRNYSSGTSIRLPGFDYTTAGAYFVTICAHDHQLLFGRITGSIMCLNSFGKIVRDCWVEIPAHFEFVETQTYIIMPNHIHGIIFINHTVETRHAVSKNDFVSGESFGKPVNRSLPTIIRSFKSAVTRKVNINRGIKRLEIWQKGYYEHVIRGEKELTIIGEYILGNPQKWEADRENPYAVRKEKPLNFEC